MLRPTAKSGAKSEAAKLGARAKSAAKPGQPDEHAASASTSPRAPSPQAGPKPKPKPSIRPSIRPSALKATEETRLKPKSKAKGQKSHALTSANSKSGTSDTAGWEEALHTVRGTKRSASENDFAAMAAAVKSHKTAIPKHVKAPSSIVSPDYQEKDPYRLAHGIRAWASWDVQEAVPLPWQFFEHAQMPHELLYALRAAGFQAPTPIQAQVWPVAFNGTDVIGIARTGSGKTLAYLYPAYCWMRARAGSGVRSLMLAPTRELATQIHEEATKFAHASGFSSACVYGGVPKKEQLPAVRQGAPILVATPGRLNDFLEYKQISLAGVAYLVFDEADRMLDMGFEPQIRDIVAQLPKRRQTLMFSATWPEEVQSLAHDFLKDPVHIQVGDPTSLQANEDISQQIMIIDPQQKDATLLQVIQQARPDERILVFVAMRKQCDMVVRALRRHGINASAMHSDKDQQEREEALRQFRCGEVVVLVATDVAARGLDIKGVTLVLNYDTANNTEDYVHRIGRTGRAGQKGRSLTFLTRSGEDAFKAVGIAEVMEKAGCPIPPELGEVVERTRRRQQQAKLNENKWEALPKVLMVAEKPSVAKLVAESLSNGRMRFRKGQSRAVQTYEFVAWFAPAQQKCQIIQTSTIGHIFGLDFDGRPPDLADLFYAKVKKTVEGAVAKNRVVEHIQELASTVDYLALWLDCDREGENICYEVMSLCGNVPEENVYRAHFSALTQPEIKMAFQNLGRPDKQMAMAVDARQELDLKIGVAFTRLMTRTFLDWAKEKFRVWDQTCLSYGPCQTPTLWFCVERHKEIERFRHQDTFTPSVTVNIEEYPVELRWVEGTTLDQQRAQSLERKLQAASRAKFVKVTAVRKKGRRPVGLNTVQLLKAASTGLGISPAQTMKIAEGLYSSGYISYPRTETTKYSQTFDLVGALQEQVHHPSWGKTVGYLLRQGQVRSPVSGTDKGDHPPITPMKAAPKDEFSKGKEWRLYEYVTRHFIASLMDDVEYDEVSYVFEVASEHFVFTYHQVAERGFLYAMPWKANDLKLEEIDWDMPAMSAGDEFDVCEMAVTRDTTKPPDYLKESELVSLMDKNGIGTDASIPQHVQNVVDRHYVMICGPGGDGQKGEVISKGKGKDKGRKGKGKGKGQKGGKGEDGRPASRPDVCDVYCAFGSLRASRYTAGQPNVTWRLAMATCLTAEAGRVLDIEVVVFNRWGIGASLMVQVNISQVPQPSLDISASPLNATPFHGVALRADVKQSGCLQAPLSYSWSLLSVSASPAVTPSSSQAMEDRAWQIWESPAGGSQLAIGWNSPSLLFPPLSLAAGVIYTFELEVKPLTSLPGYAAATAIDVRVDPSPLQMAFQQPLSVIRRGPKMPRSTWRRPLTRTTLRRCCPRPAGAAKRWSRRMRVMAWRRCWQRALQTAQTQMQQCYCGYHCHCGLSRADLRLPHCWCAESSARG
ncbi:unnamed protein product [Effrenium voratum]|nr:unnamed protein product [Effrenium voratum]